MLSYRTLWYNALLKKLCVNLRNKPLICRLILSAATNSRFSSEYERFRLIRPNCKPKLHLLYFCEMFWVRRRLHQTVRQIKNKSNKLQQIYSMSNCCKQCSLGFTCYTGNSSKLVILYMNMIPVWLDCDYFEAVVTVTEKTLSGEKCKAKTRFNTYGMVPSPDKHCGHFSRYAIHFGA